MFCVTYRWATTRVARFSPYPPPAPACFCPPVKGGMWYKHGNSVTTKGSEAWAHSDLSVYVTSRKFPEEASCCRFSRRLRSIKAHFCEHGAVVCEGEREVAAGPPSGQPLARCANVSRSGQPLSAGLPLMSHHTNKWVIICALSVSVALVYCVNVLIKNIMNPAMHSALQRWVLGCVWTKHLYIHQGRACSRLSSRFSTGYFPLESCEVAHKNVEEIAIDVALTGSKVASWMTCFEQTQTERHLLEESHLVACRISPNGCYDVFALVFGTEKKTS